MHAVAMTVDEFVAKHKKTLDEFLTFWQHGREQKPEYFPLNMHRSEWCEQLDLFELINNK